MDIRFECPQCRQRVAIDEAGAGLQIECPGCQSPLTVPTPVQPPPTRTLPRLRTQTSAEPTSPPPMTPPPVMQAPAKPGTGAQYACNNPHCGVTLFESQVLTQQVAGRTLMVCPKCRMAVSKLTAPMSFWSHVPRAFIYPFQGNGVWIMIPSVLFLAVIELTRKFLGFGLFILGTLATGYFGMMFMDIIRTTANDENATMDLPEFSDFNEIKQTAGQLAISGLLILSPALICFWLSGYSSFAESAQQWLDPQSWRMLALAFTGLALVYYPMGLLAVSMFDTIASVNPFIVAPAILRTFVQYLLVLVLLGVMWGLREGTSVILMALPWGWRFAVYLPIEFYCLYSLLVTARVLGLLYKANASRLHWFD